jgi:hypothetical protein
MNINALYAKARKGTPPMKHRINRYKSVCDMIGRAIIGMLTVVLSFPVGIAQSAQCAPGSAGSWNIEGRSMLKKSKYERNFSGLACTRPLDALAVCIIVQDEDFEMAIAHFAPNLLRIVKTVDLPGKSTSGEFDAEGATHSGTYFYVLGSHSRKGKSCQANPDSQAFVRFSIDPATLLPGPYERSRPIREIIASLPNLAPGLDQCLGSKRPVDADGDWQPAHGLNFEGVAVSGDRVFLGLRGPVIGGAAQIVEASVDNLFRSGKSPARARSLTLSPAGGIRDLASHGDRVLILSGSEDDDTGGAAIHLWDGSSATAKKLCDIPDPPKDSEDKPEALLVLEGPDDVLRVLILSDGPAGGNPREFVISLQ